MSHALATRFGRVLPAVRLLLPAVGFSLAAHGAAAASFVQTQNDTDAAASPAPVVVYLVRHAEKAEDGTTDPPLAVAGRIRVQLLRHLLAATELSHVHTTDWRRTRETARPIAEDVGVEPAFYDAEDAEAFADRLVALGHRHLVVGHSNTIPGLVAALGGDPGSPISEMEYDRLYQIVLAPGQPPLTTMLRFGEPYVEGRDFGLRSSWDPRMRGPPIGS